jgi:hypothetical protein
LRVPTPSRPKVWSKVLMRILPVLVLVLVLVEGSETNPVRSKDLVQVQVRSNVYGRICIVGSWPVLTVQVVLSAIETMHWRIC